MTSSFDSSTDCSLLVFFGTDMRCNMSFGIIVFEIPDQIFNERYIVIIRQNRIIDFPVFFTPFLQSRFNRR